MGLGMGTVLNFNDPERFDYGLVYGGVRRDAVLLREGVAVCSAPDGEATVRQRVIRGVLTPFIATDLVVCTVADTLTLPLALHATSRRQAQNAPAAPGSEAGGVPGEDVRSRRDMEVPRP
jgi:hypothetical protein